jgi:hypothetical protein
MTTDQTAAARTMLTALKERAAWNATPSSLRGTGWDAYGEKIANIERAAIEQAEAAGIEEEIYE